MTSVGKFQEKSCLTRQVFLYKYLGNVYLIKSTKLQEATLESKNKKIVLARHGETIFNRAGFIMGRSNSALTPEGVSTAKQVARLVEQQNIRTVFSSSLGRARLSAEIYTEGLGLPIFMRDAMAELGCGDWEGKPRSEVGEGAPLIRMTWLDKPPGGESYSDGEARVAGFIEEITSPDIQYPILVVGHASVNRVFLKLLLGLDSECAMMINSPHDTIYLIEGRQRVMAKSVTGLETEGLLFHLDRFPSHEGRGCG